MTFNKCHFMWATQIVFSSLKSYTITQSQPESNHSLKYQNSTLHLSIGQKV